MPKESKARSMPKWQAAPAEMVSTFERAMADVPQAQVRKMFGYPAAFVNGQLFAGLFQDKMFLRLSADDLALCLKSKGAAPFEPMPGRPMRAYAVVPRSVLKSKAQLNGWLGKAFAYASTLPPKEKPTKARRSQR